MSDRLLTFYGDDFTGSTDALEVLASAGISTVLFLTTPDDTHLARFPEARVVGVAGISRSQDPAWMDANLPPVFERLKAIGAPLCHYKVCSTFDSAPHVGSIGRAAELGQAVFGAKPVPVVVGAPALGGHNAQTLTDLGYTDEQIAQLEAAGIVTDHPPS